jgi:hypothetical protein
MSLSRVPCPHLHLHREGYADKWAFPLPRDRFRNPADLWASLEDFVRFCSVTEPPLIEKGLFA